MNSEIYDLIVEAKKVLSINAGYYTKKNALDYIYDKVINNRVTTNELEEIEKSVPGIMDKIGHLQVLIETAKNTMNDDTKAISILLSMHKDNSISKEEYELMEKYVPGINERIEQLSKEKTIEPDYYNIDIENVNKEKEKLNLELRKLEEQKIDEEKIRPLNEEEKTRHQQMLNEIEQEKNNTLEKINDINNTIDNYNEQHKFDNINLEEYERQKEKLNLELKKLEEQQKEEEKLRPLNEEEKIRKEELLKEIENERNNNLQKLEQINYAIEMHNKGKAQNIDSSNLNKELDEYTKNLIKHKDEISKAIYDYDTEKLSSLVQNNIISKEHLKEISESSEYKKDGELVNDLYNDVMNLVNKTNEKQKVRTHEDDYLRGDAFDYNSYFISDMLDKKPQTTTQSFKKETTTKQTNENTNNLNNDSKIILPNRMTKEEIDNALKALDEIKNGINNNTLILSNNLTEEEKQEKINAINNLKESLNKNEIIIPEGKTLEDQIKALDEVKLLTSDTRTKEDFEKITKAFEEIERKMNTPRLTEKLKEEPLLDKSKNQDIYDLMDKFKEAVLSREAQKQPPVGPDDNPTPPEEPEDEPTNGDDDEEKEKQEKLRKVGLNVDQIIADAIGDTKVYIKDEKVKGKLQASNIKIKDVFYNDLKTGNVVYNVSKFVKTGIKAAKILFDKITARRVDEETKKRINKISEGFNNLTLEQKKVLYEEFKGSTTLGKKLPGIVLNEISKTVEDYGRTKSSPLIMDNINLYQQIMNDFAKVKGIDEKLKDNLTEEQKNNLLIERQNLLNGKTKLIEKFNNTNTEIKNINSSGIYGTKEDIKASKVGYATDNYQGNKFATKHDLNNELIQKEAELKTAEQKAIALNDDEAALKNFADYWMLRYDNTQTEDKRLLGEISTGEREFYPVEGLKDINHEKDPLVRDLIGTAALATATIGAVTSAYNHFANDNLIDNFNNELNKSNETINKIGEDITSKHDTMVEGMTSDIYSKIAGAQDNLERSAFINPDYQNYGANASYAETDALNHETIAELYKGTEASFKSTMDKYINGNISQTDALSQIADVANNSQQQINQIYAEILPGFKEYAANNPEYDLTGLVGSLEKVVANPDATVNFNNGIVEIMKDGERLANFNIETLSGVKSNLAASLAAAVATSAAVGKYMDVPKTLNKNQDVSKTLQESLNKVTKKAKDAKENKKTKEERNKKYTKSGREEIEKQRKEREQAVYTKTAKDVETATKVEEPKKQEKKEEKSFKEKLKEKLSKAGAEKANENKDIPLANYTQVEEGKEQNGPTR